MKRIINSGYDDLKEFIDGIPSGTFAYSGKTLYKGRNEVKLFKLEGGQKVVVKKFREPNIFNRIIYTFFRGSKADRAYRNAGRLENMGVGTPRAIACIDLYRNGLVSNSYLITEYTDFTPAADIEKEDRVYQVMITNALVDFTVELHKKGICHQDFNKTNVLYERSGDGSCKFMLIDINRMSFGPMSRRKCLASVRRICVDPEVTYYMSQKYAEARGWNKYRSMAAFAVSRLMFEQRKQFRRSLKRLIGQPA